MSVEDSVNRAVARGRCRGLLGYGAVGAVAGMVLGSLGQGALEASREHAEGALSTPMSLLFFALGGFASGAILACTRQTSSTNRSRHYVRFLSAAIIGMQIVVLPDVVLQRSLLPVVAGLFLGTCLGLSLGFSVIAYTED